MDGKAPPARAASQCLVYFAVAQVGDRPTDGVTDLNPEGLTAAYGRHAKALAHRLKAAGVLAREWSRFGATGRTPLFSVLRGVQPAVTCILSTWSCCVSLS